MISTFNICGLEFSKKLFYISKSGILNGKNIDPQNLYATTLFDTVQDLIQDYHDKSKDFTWDQIQYISEYEFYFPHSLGGADSVHCRYEMR